MEAADQRHQLEEHGERDARHDEGEREPEFAALHPAFGLRARARPRLVELLGCGHGCSFRA